MRTPPLSASRGCACATRRTSRACGAGGQERRILRNQTSDVIHASAVVTGMSAASQHRARRGYGPINLAPCFSSGQPTHYAERHYFGRAVPHSIFIPGDDGGVIPPGQPPRRRAAVPGRSGKTVMRLSKPSDRSSPTPSASSSVRPCHPCVSRLAQMKQSRSWWPITRLRCAS
jgi:hypothetical protein